MDKLEKEEWMIIFGVIIAFIIWCIAISIA